MLRLPVTSPDKKVKHVSKQTPAIGPKYLLVILQGTDEMGIPQKAAIRTSQSFDVLSNHRDAPYYHQSKMKRNLHYDSAIIHPNFNSS
jgi:hypothetical protein